VRPGIDVVLAHHIARYGALSVARDGLSDRRTGDLDTGVIAKGQDVGTANTFRRQVDGQVVTLLYDGDRFIDQETGSEWNMAGRAIAGASARDCPPVRLVV